MRLLGAAMQGGDTSFIIAVGAVVLASLSFSVGIYLLLDTLRRRRALTGGKRPKVHKRKVVPTARSISEVISVAKASQPPSERPTPVATATAAPVRQTGSDSELMVLYLTEDDVIADDEIDITMVGDFEIEGLDQIVVTVTDGVAQPQATEVVLELEDIVEEAPLLRVKAAGRTDRGKVRHENEDRYLMLDEVPLFVVADGMGGYAGGEVAATMAVDIIERAFRTRNFDGPSHCEWPAQGDELAKAFHMAHQAVHAKAMNEPRLGGMGTTVVAARFARHRRAAFIAHVGDSRCYRIRGQQITQLTRDHTLAVLLGVEGKAGRKLTQAVGVSDQIAVDLFVDEPEPRDLYLICSDGLTRMVDDSTILRFALESGDPDWTATRLVEEANARGGKDNVTVIVIRVESPGIDPVRFQA
jgi:serine/threonine protein phosphatase PrpC